MLGAQRIPETAGGFIGDYGGYRGIIGSDAGSTEYQGDGFTIVFGKCFTAGMVCTPL